MRHDLPEAPEEVMPPSHTPEHSGALGSGGQAYNEDISFPSTEHPAAETRNAPTPAPVSSSVPRPGGLGRGFWIGLLAAAVVLALIVLYGLHTRAAADRTLATETKSDVVPEVKTIHPTGGASGTLTLPGTATAYVDTPIYSRTNGYLKRWFFDIGAHVRKGQLLATIETPELDEQLQVAQADLKSAEANLNLANTTSARYQNLLKSNSVSKQETDVAMGDAASKQAAVEAAMASVRRYQQLQSFEKVYAPFDGVITARNTDIGDLITGGSASAGNAKQLFHLAALSTLRVFVSVPESYSGVVRDGGVATLTADEYPGQTFEGKIARNANAIDPSSRTLNVEVDVPNASGKLLPGAYVMVHFNTPTRGNNLTIPSNTLLFRAQGLQVGVVRDGRVHLVPVKIAQDHGATVEIASGLSMQDAIILDPSDSLTNNQMVKVTPAGSEK